MPFSESLTHADAIDRYIEIAPRLPSARFPEHTQHVHCLGDLKDEFDVFVLDGFGVLNVGEDTVPGAVESVAGLQQAGKSVFVLTNGATRPVEDTHKKYLQWGFRFELAHIVSSRNALERALLAEEDTFRWGVAATASSAIEHLAPNTVKLDNDASVYADVDGFVFLSSSDWSDQRQAMLADALAKKPRPLLVGNPDLVAPREDAMSIEPGYYSHALADASLCVPRFYGKPFSDAFEIVNERIGYVPAQRICMVGDTLHTDILGGAAFGWRTVLIKDHGLMKHAELEATVAASGIRPDFVALTT